MPTVILNKTVLEKLVGKKLALDQLKDRISMLGTDLEKIENNEIHVEVFPNRPDMLSEQGFARALSSFIGAKPGLRKYNIRKSGLKVIIDPSVAMRPYTACAIVKNIHFTEERLQEIIQMQEKLALTHGRNRKKSAYGIYPLDNIHFPIQYIAKDPADVIFQPLGFDRKIAASQVEELHPKGKEYKDIAKGWKKYPFFIDSRENVLSMLPYTNSEDTGKVDTTTKNIFVECSGTDLANVTVALNMFAAMFADMGGDVYSIEMAYPTKTITTPNLTSQKMKMDISYINKRLGLSLDEKEVKVLLARMGYGYSDGCALIPAYRADILHPVDLMEDIAIAYGYENFHADIPNVATIGEENPLAVLHRSLRDILIGFGLMEVTNYSLLTKEEIYDKMKHRGPAISLKNSLGEHTHLRPALLPSLMKTLSENQHNEYPQNIFELGQTFVPDKITDIGIEECEHLAVALCHETSDFTGIRQILDALAHQLNISLTIKECAHPSFIHGRSAEVLFRKESIGFIGEIHPSILEQWNLTAPVAVFEINMEKL